MGAIKRLSMTIYAERTHGWIITLDSHNMGQITVLWMLELLKGCRRTWGFLSMQHQTRVALLQFMRWRGTASPLRFRSTRGVTCPRARHRVECLTSAATAIVQVHLRPLLLSKGVLSGVGMSLRLILWSL